MDISLDDQVVRILGSLPIVDLEAAIKKSGRKARLIGQGDPEREFGLQSIVLAQQHYNHHHHHHHHQAQGAGGGPV